MLLTGIVADSLAAIEVETKIITLTGDAAPDGNGTIVDLGGPVLNDIGQVAFNVRYFSDPPSNGPFGLLVSDAADGLTTIARTGDNPPDGNGRFRNVGGFPLLNNAGQVAFTGYSSPFIGSDEALYLSNGAGELLQIAQTGDAPPDGTGTLSGFGNPKLNEGGQVAFRVFYSPANVTNSQGIIRSDPTGELVPIFRTGGPSPDGNGTMRVVGDLSLNDAGQTAFQSYLIETVGGQSDNEGLFLAEADKDLVQLAREGDSVPGGVGLFGSFGNPILNNAGEAVFHSSLTDTTNFGDNEGLFRSDSRGNLVQIVREGDAAPDGNGEFMDVGGTPITTHSGKSPAINDAGQVALVAELRGTSDGESDNQGLYLYDNNLGLTQLARTGDPFQGSRITSLFFLDGTTGSGSDLGTERSALNERGQVAYLFVLADGREGIAIATIIPEPSTLLLVLLTASITIGQWRFRS